MPFRFTKKAPSVGESQSGAWSRPGWRLLVATSKGLVLVPEVGLVASESGVAVVRDGKTEVRSWPWALVERVRIGAEFPSGGDNDAKGASASENHASGSENRAGGSENRASGGDNGGGHRIVELWVGGSHHRFTCPVSDLERWCATVLHEAPELDLQTPPGMSHRNWRARLGAAAASIGLDRGPGGRFDRISSASANLRLANIRERPAFVRTGACALALLGGGLLAASASSTGAAQASNRLEPSDSPSGSIMQQMEHQYSGRGLQLAPATTPPAPAPPSLADSPALKAHEIFGFAPYWTLPVSAGFDVNDMSTLAYFSLDVNANGSIDETGPGWAGYQSQDLSNLITRAHQADDRVVLAVTCFDQSTLDALTSDPSAAGTLASSLVQLLEAKSLDGVNLDFEGQGSQDQKGLDILVSEVSSALHSADPHWQVTMDTYASSAGDPNGFYDIAGLAPSVNAFFVMAYDLEDQSTPSPTAPLTGPAFSDVDALEQYSAVVTPSKVILGVPYYGYDWPTVGPAQGQAATGGPSPEPYASIVSGSHPVYWDATTQTPWSSYQVGTQWHQTWFDDAISLALKAQLANAFHLAGLGVWALGMDGNDPSMLAALLGHAPPVKNFQPSPVAPAAPATSSTTTAPASQPSSSPASPAPAAPPGLPGGPHPGPGTTTTAPSQPPTTTTAPAQPSHPPYSYGGRYGAQQVILDKVNPGMLPADDEQPAGDLTNFTTNDPTYTCLEKASSLVVSWVKNSNGLYMVDASTPSDCVTGTWEFVSSTSGGATSSNSANIVPSSSSSTSTTSSHTTSSSMRPTFQNPYSTPRVRNEHRARWNASRYVQRPVRIV